MIPSLACNHCGRHTCGGECQQISLSTIIGSWSGIRFLDAPPSAAMFDDLSSGKKHGWYRKFEGKKYKRKGGR